MRSTLLTLPAFLVARALAQSPFYEHWSVPEMFTSTNPPFNIQLGETFQMTFTVDWPIVSCSLYQTQVENAVVDGKIFGNTTIFANKPASDFSDGTYLWTIELGHLSLATSADFFFVLWNGPVGAPSNITSAYFTIFDPLGSAISSSISSSGGTTTTVSSTAAPSSVMGSDMTTSAALMTVATVATGSSITASASAPGTASTGGVSAGTTIASSASAIKASTTASVTPSSDAPGGFKMGVLGSLLMGAGVLFGMVL